MSVALYKWDTLAEADRARLLARSGAVIEDLRDTVEPIVAAVQAEGDTALIRLTQEFDGVDISTTGIAVTTQEFKEAKKQLDPAVRGALDFAIENVRRFHQAQVEPFHRTVEVRRGVIATERSTPIESAGLYVPSGRGSFPSMLYMLAVPATLAGVPTIAVTTPPRRDGTVDPGVLYAADQCGIETVYRVGGAQAIAALAFGTESIPAVRKAIGPGSAYVAAAKRLVADRIDVGLPAGPSESIVLADASADPWLVALDLMIEAEHGSDSAALLVTESETVATATARYIEHLLKDVPGQRRSFLEEVFTRFGGIIVTSDAAEAVALVNRFAPEHLMIHSADPKALAQDITEASEILLGPHTAFSLANYATGANAILPTGGWAHTWGPVSVRDFQKTSSLVEVTAEGYDLMRDHVIALADYEGFYTHAAALRRRHEERPF
jgi:histidinol dehydrogenase